MSSFTKPLTVTKVVDIKKEKFLWFTRTIRKHWWLVDRKFDYHVGGLGSKDVITVPKNFKTDFASVPRLFWRLFPPDGVYSQAAVLHDFLCVYPDRSQKEVDLIFLEAMEVLGVPAWKRNTMYQAVRAFQWAKNPKMYDKWIT